MSAMMPEPWIAVKMERRPRETRIEPIFDDGLWAIQVEGAPERRNPIAIVDRGDDHDAPTRADAERVARILSAAADLAWAASRILPYLDLMWPPEESGVQRERLREALRKAVQKSGVLP